MVATLSPPPQINLKPNGTKSAGLKTYEDYAQLPEGAKYQLIDGEIIEMTAPTVLHQSVSIELGTALKNYVRANGLGRVFYAPIDVYLSETDTPQPDLIFIAKANLDIIGEQKIEGAPDLVVEILSPSTAYLDLKKKKRLYEKSGVREYWIVDPLEKSIEVFVHEDGQFQLFGRAEGQENLRSKLLPELALEMTALFA